MAEKKEPEKATPQKATAEKAAPSKSTSSSKTSSADSKSAAEKAFAENEGKVNTPSSDPSYPGDPFSPAHLDKTDATAGPGDQDNDGDSDGVAGSTDKDPNPGQAYDPEVLQPPLPQKSDESEFPEEKADTSLAEGSPVKSENGRIALVVTNRGWLQVIDLEDEKVLWEARPYHY